MCTGKEVEPNTGTSQAHTHSHRKEQRLKKAFSHTRGQTHRHTQGLAKCLVTRASLHTQGPSNSICYKHSHTPAVGPPGHSWTQISWNPLTL